MSGAAGAAGAFSGMSVTRLSVVRTMAETLALFSMAIAFAAESMLGWIVIRAVLRRTDPELRPRPEFKFGSLLIILVAVGAERCPAGPWLEQEGCGDLHRRVHADIESLDHFASRADYAAAFSLLEGLVGGCQRIAVALVGPVAR